MMKVKLLTYTPNPEQVVATAAKLCYSKSDVDSLFEKQTPEVAEKFLNRLLSLGHESPLEHCSFTFAIEGVSRSLTHQLVRHRLASYSQQSQRYVSMEEFNPVIPEDILNNEEALKMFNYSIENVKYSYNKIADILLKQYLKEGEDTHKAEKKAYENARAILPNACDTKIIVTMNARSLMNFFKHRACKRAQTEINEMAWIMLGLVKEVAPALFKYAGPGCVTDKCPEGKMTCGKPYERIDK